MEQVVACWMDANGNDVSTLVSWMTEHTAAVWFMFAFAIWIAIVVGFCAAQWMEDRL